MPHGAVIRAAVELASYVEGGLRLVLASTVCDLYRVRMADPLVDEAGVA